MTDPPPIRLLYLEDVLSHYEFVCGILRPRGYDVLPQCKTIDEARTGVTEWEPQVLLADLGLDRRDLDIANKVMQFLADLRKDRPQLTLLIYSGIEALNFSIVRQALVIGVSYLIKEALQDLDHLDRAIQCAKLGRGVVYDIQAAELFKRAIEVQDFTPQQLKVAQLIEMGMQNVEIARELGISSSRISQHIENICKIAGLRSRGEIPRWYYTRYRTGSTAE
ncbi:MAG: response regulator transcription factor [Anaerolineae bacterium]|nr:response regulator transcription factor [Anaerolineae bacterium]